MKPLQGLWLQTAALWLLCLVACSSCAVFYTQSRDNNYPRIGRRAFFTRGDKGSSYPRIGRSSPGPEAQQVMTGNDVGFRSPPKQSLLTDQERHTMGIGHGEELRNLELSAPAALMTSLEDPDVVEPVEAGSSWLPLGLLFFSFDKNGDQVLTREEFAEGMITTREDGTAC